LSPIGRGENANYNASPTKGQGSSPKSRRQYFREIWVLEKPFDEPENEREVGFKVTGTARGLQSPRKKKLQKKGNVNRCRGRIGPYAMGDFHE